ncbi:hypothetical protein E2C01_014053 [Portunus trituberculatus]|uniref:Uncharacterized protein n=1 Tax=Portunus trituberculatus TaxID=210409 RepID=A0A5B7DI65_PORTR|nr:hypothetical protein [Portunus trituberculatus]
MGRVLTTGNVGRGKRGVCQGGVDEDEGKGERGVGGHDRILPLSLHTVCRGLHGCPAPASVQCVAGLRVEAWPGRDGSLGPSPAGALGKVGGK